MSPVKTVLSFLLAVSFLPCSFASESLPQESPSSSVPWRVALAEANRLVEEHPQWHLYRGAGESMIPHYGSHSLLIVQKAPLHALRPGMIAVFEDSAGDRVGHLVAEVHEGGISTKGVRSYSTDPGKLTQSNFLGIVTAVMHTSRNDRDEPDLPRVTGKRY